MVSPLLHGASSLRLSAPDAVRHEATTGQGVRPVECDLPESVGQRDGGDRDESQQQAPRPVDEEQAQEEDSTAAEQAGQPGRRASGEASTAPRGSLPSEEEDSDDDSGTSGRWLPVRRSQWKDVQEKAANY